jgi:ketosteroid isomerase-like protein
MNNKTQYLLGGLVWLTVGLSSHAIAQTRPSADELAIRNARIAQTKALAENDLDRVQSYWTSDVTIRRALGQPLAGIEAARKVLEPTGSGAPTVVYQRETMAVEVSTNWPLAYEEGRWSGYLGKVGTAPVIEGRYSAQWVKRNGEWLIRSEVFVALTCAESGCKYPAAP